jgi:hypothetical protein
MPGGCGAGVVAQAGLAVPKKQRMEIFGRKKAGARPAFPKTDRELPRSGIEYY